ncbi:MULTISPECIES: ABC transporter ATP-binding protein [unclassified Streptomyces]|uniref:ABC transporter ATP-binding protein n=1 Tax=unclassified Streptomyces TaxID=2593676 RepID=UPI002251352B|nr:MULTISPECIES: ABC transporter ATP-binding protein [unclassified Streptomyces]MCX4407894.1 ABC transporter ATP-binding protein/permease [Streptomyces sp. NBC_01764]MCX5187381.1 ABC transporter ATP-binding protein/permease [Streptomyces sp. NBC_00268]
MIDAYEDPGTPDCRGGWRYLWWLVTRQAGRSTAGALLATVWMVLLALPPYLLSRAIDDGLEPGDQGALLGWTAAVFGIGVFNAWLGIMRHRTMTKVRMDANFRTVKVVVEQSARLGAALARQVGAGEVVTIGVGDVQTISQSLTVVGPGIAAIVTYGVVAAQLTSVSLQLSVVILLGVPLTAGLVGPLMSRLQGAETEYRERQGVLTARIGDLAGGLRVLNGLGGKGLFADTFRRDSQELRAQGYRVGAATSWIQALGTGLPTLFLAVVTWLAARLAAQGEITIGQLVSVYGYVAVLVMPVYFLIQSGYQLSRAVVAARRVVRFLSLEPVADRPDARDAPASPAVLHDPDSGVRVLPGRLTALVGALPAESEAVVDRLGRYAESAVTWGGVRLDGIALAQVRERILVADNEADLFAGTLRELVSGRREHDEEAIAQAVRTAAADDIVLGLPDGLDSAVDAQGRSLSGGQRQRVRLVRALLADPEVLLAVEPTSALDAHTEAAVAARLRAARSGRTTVVTSTSPLMLDQVDTVYFLVDGKVAASGGHRELLDGEPGYRALVARDVDALDDLDDLEALDAGEGIDGVDGVDAEEALR